MNQGSWFFGKSNFQSTSEIPTSVRSLWYCPFLFYYRWKWTQRHLRPQTWIFQVHEQVLSIWPCPGGAVARPLPSGWSENAIWWWIGRPALYGGCGKIWHQKKTIGVCRSIFTLNSKNWKGQKLRRNTLWATPSAAGPRPLLIALRLWILGIFANRS